MIATQDQELTHVCENIGPAERAKRNRIAVIGGAVTVFGVALVLVEHLGWQARLAVGLPAFMGAMGYFQARARTCVAFVAAGVRVMGDSRSSAQRIVDPAEKAAFRKKAAVIYGQSLATTAAIVGLLLLLP